MVKDPLISVIIPCYNDGIFLKETLSHLKEQTFKDFEIIIVDDGSTDEGTAGILRQLENDEVKVLHKENGRMSSARNYGVKHAKGSIIVALDADDYFHPTFFEKGLKVLNNKLEVAVVSSYIELFGEFKKVSRPRGGDVNNFLFSNQCPACAMVRKVCWEAVNGYDEEMKNGYEDWEFYLRITKNGWTVHIIPEILFYYRQTKKSTHKNYTIPNRQALINYIIDKHRELYLFKLKELVNNEQIIYRKSRISYPIIFEMIKSRLSGRYRHK